MAVEKMDGVGWARHGRSRPPERSFCRQPRHLINQSPCFPFVAFAAVPEPVRMRIWNMVQVVSMPQYCLDFRTELCTKLSWDMYEAKARKCRGPYTNTRR
jgi:hypothetical protein